MILVFKVWSFCERVGLWLMSPYGHIAQYTTFFRASSITTPFDSPFREGREWHWHDFWAWPELQISRPLVLQ